MRRMSRDPTAALPSESAKGVSRVEMGELPIRRVERSAPCLKDSSLMFHGSTDPLPMCPRRPN